MTTTTGSIRRSVIALAGVVLLWTVGACGGAEAGPEVGVSLGYLIGDRVAQESNRISYGGEVCTPVDEVVTVRCSVTYQDYEDDDGLEAEYTSIGVGARINVPALAWGRVSIHADVSPLVVFSRWRDSGLDNRGTELGVVFGAGVAVLLGGAWKAGANIRHYECDGTAVYYSDRPTLELPGLSSTLLEVGLSLRLGE